MRNNKIQTGDGRLVCLDILRGLDMFILIPFGYVLSIMKNAGVSSDIMNFFGTQRSHVAWTGFHGHDLLMPLFMFCAGAAIPYSMSKYFKPGQSKKEAYWRIVRRVIVLWIFGMICQGNLLSFQPENFRYFSNTLQSIAVGYAFSAIMFLNTKPRTQVLTAVGLLIAYWAALMFIKVDGYGGGNFTGTGNLCEWVDRQVLGFHCDHVQYLPDGTKTFREGNNYCWILPSLNFCVTVMSGMFAGELLKNKERSNSQKFWYLFCGGIILAALGWLWNLQMPVIKVIWTSSMVIVTSGYSYILLSLCFLIADWKKCRALHWLIPLGTNCMLAYMMRKFVDFGNVTAALCGGLTNVMSAPLAAVIKTTLTLMLYMFFFDMLHKHKIFFKV